MKSAVRQGIKSAFQAMGGLKKEVTYKRLTGETYNESTGQYENEYSEIPVDVVITDYSLSEVKETTIKHGDKKVFLPASQVDFTPKSGDDSIIIDGSSHSIQSVRNKFDELFILQI